MASKAEDKDSVLTDVLARMLELISQIQNREQRPELTIEALAPSIKEFSFDPEKGTTFDKWYCLYEDIFREDAKALSEAARVRLLLRKLSPNCHAGYVNSLLPRAPRDLNYEQTVEALNKLYGSRESLFHIRWKCLQMQKDEADDFKSHSTKVNKACEDFRLGDLTPEHFKVLIFIMSLRDSKDKEVRSRLLRLLDTEDPSKITLNLMAEESIRFTTIKSDSAVVEQSAQGNNSSLEVCAVKQKPVNSKGKAHTHKHTNSQKFPKTTPPSPCWQCGGMHFVKFCEYSNKTCPSCSKKGHKDGYCGVVSAKKKHPQKKQQVSVNTITTDVCSVTSLRRSVDVKINNITYRLLYDPGSEVTIISDANWRLMGSPPLQNPSITARDAQGNPLTFHGELHTQVTFREMNRAAKCLISTSDINLFGADWITLFGLWNEPASSFTCNAVNAIEGSTITQDNIVTELKQKFPTVFSSSLGKYNKAKGQLRLKPNCAPVFRPRRPVPIHMTQLVDEELQRLQNLKIITPVDYSEYAAPIVIVRKPNGSIRICADYSTGLNSILETHHYPIPTPERIFASLSSSKIFSKVDLSDAYLQIEMDDESRRMLSISTHRGIFEFNRLCPGVKSAPGIFQQTLDTVLAGIPSVFAYFDDVLVATPDMETHGKALLAVFERFHTNNLRVKLEKCKFFMKEVRFLGIVIDASGQRPDPDKSHAIACMPPPTNVAELRSFLGALTFYSRFVRHMSEIRQPLDSLLRKDVAWQWTLECQQAFQKFKEILLSNLLLMHYNPSLPVIVAGDASEAGIGCVAFHKLEDGSLKAFHHASRRLSQTEKNYSQIEKEGLALVFAVTKFHNYIYGRRFVMQTDHKPLLAIFGSKKGIPIHTANRLQRWALILLAYEFTLEFVPTDKFGAADILSRLIQQHPRPTDEDFVVASVESDGIDDSIIQDVVRNIPVTFRMIQNSTQKCPILLEVASLILKGWPLHSANLSAEVSEFFKFRESLSLIRSCIMYRERIVIPSNLRTDILKQLHDAHPGITRMKALARSYVFWPKIDKDIEDLVKNCANCVAVAKFPTKSVLYSWPLSTRPWQRVHADFAGPVNGLWFLVLVDSYTKWPEVYTMSSTTATATITNIGDACARLGFMETLVTDCGRQFDCMEFNTFCEMSGIMHITTPPYHPQSNGQAERFVDTLKRSMKKLKDSGDVHSSLQKFLMNYRATPNPNTFNGTSPSELMLGRQLRIPLDLIKPPEDEPPKRNVSMEEMFNKKHGAKNRFFSVGEKVYARQGDKTEWTPGTIIEKRGNVLYNVLLEFTWGTRLIRAHTNQIITRTGAALSSPPPDALVVPPPKDPVDPISQRRRNPRVPTRTSPIKLRSREPRST
ncbi:uncharacterized protein K02A2.6-like [Phlebotomus papatasi]|uniref:uncharacterized protein K02A2.6-like n=1 Tax=Phlebotomus papatasi TaxID=29031 RepID=UPI0024845E24|nr:uncharacterized protein K02A2.6-like [Phlebotomus papatasi]